ncbi:unnamed protein product [Vitrella brassicaformis CCMP3155]|uniref:Adenylate kinase isoenzyme 6 homolog n=1 Tax=Vitrella brassicaformis (strain CCMP3155) TaxID=1169540 RepID=A0A0G4EQY5_VITBC|nr:unnamed protein product [Vitrella brassicaformis CCMP3155]|mmetsp:Transcript_48776/g.122147  ORF Transcript_48776/g.122147 Transcript_48776/m.122147 type:complete len:177 (-) Transcript_48776:1210-1740(-)|eukprot:CEL99981.1 unnamed protein product [Vitrella brassicaformis CCMP3155]
MQRSRPNILVTGTPGTGKSTLCQLLCEQSGLHHVELARLIREEHLYTEWDDEMNCSIFDEDLVVSKLSDFLPEGGHVMDFHSCDFLPVDWFDLVVVLRTETSVLYGRLERRSYPERKIQENVECEIFQVLLDEAKEHFGADAVMEAWNDSLQHLDANVQRVMEWLNQWQGQVEAGG